MSVSPTPEDDVLRHPVWCDASTCTADDRLTERAEDERDVPMYRRHDHFGTAHTVPITRISDVELKLEPYRDVYQPVTDALDGVLLSWTAESCGHSGNLALSLEQLAPLATAFASLRDLADPHRSPLMDRVAEALRVLGAIDRSNAAALLSLTTVHFTDSERESVLSNFPPTESGNPLSPLPTSGSGSIGGAQ